MNIIAVVVTYNRFALLTEAIAALQNQTAALKQIVVIDNGSTDDTAGWLDAQPNISVIHQANSGGAGGFYTGIKQAAVMGADFIWVMDDDTICEPTTLERLLEKIDVIDKPVGFIGSRCNWKDGNPHLMNIPLIKPLFNDNIPFNLYDHHQLILTESSSFVSILINCEAVRKVGLPYKEFFIWGDDQEYTRRITKYGYVGFYCSTSIVLHKTPENSFTDFYNDSVKNIWKHRHGFRNEFFLVKKNKGLIFFFCWLPVKVMYASFKILKITKHDPAKFLRALWGAAWESIFFSPKIDMITDSVPVQIKKENEIPVLY